MLRTIALLLFVVALALPTWSVVQAQEAQNCLTVSEVKAILSERNGESWTYSLVDKFGVEMASCVRRDGRSLSYRPAYGEEITIRWLGTEQFGHWYRVLASGKANLVLWEREQRNLPPVPIVWIDFYQTLTVTLAVIKYTPPYKLIEQPWVFTYRVARWTMVGGELKKEFIDYFLGPTRRSNGTISANAIHYPQLMTREQGSVFLSKFTPAVMDVIEERFFEK